jgi:hypothetical protein
MLSFWGALSRPILTGRGWGVFWRAAALRPGGRDFNAKSKGTNTMNPINRILWGGGAAALFALVAVFVWLSLSNAHLKVALAQALESGMACSIANQNFVASEAQRSKAVAALKAEAEAREKRALAAAKDAQKKARVYFLAAERLRKTPLSGDTCKAAENLINSYLEGAP